jgi:hypothetical protein
MQDLQTTQPGPHVKQVRETLSELKNHLRNDGKKIEDPRAAALFETAAEVVEGLGKAFDHYAERSEAAWKK